jgi:hypothetical protein
MSPGIKSNGFKSGEEAGRALFPLRPMRYFGNTLFKDVQAARRKFV